MSSEAQARKALAARSGGLCEANIPRVCLNKAQSAHHRRKRSQGGEWDLSNLLHVCGDGTTGCHGWIEANPQAAHLRGLTLFHGDLPEQTAAYIAYRGEPGYWWLFDDGTARRIKDREQQKTLIHDRVSDLATRRTK